MTVLLLGLVFMVLLALLMDVAALVMLINANSLTGALYAALSAVHAPAGAVRP